MTASRFEDVPFDASFFSAENDGSDSQGTWIVSIEQVKYYRWERTGDRVTVQLCLDPGSEISGTSFGPPFLYVKLPDEIVPAANFFDIFAYSEDLSSVVWRHDGQLIVLNDNNPPSTRYMRLGKLPGGNWDNGTNLALFVEAVFPVVPLV